MKDEYIKQIVDLLQQCNDMSMFDFVAKLLQKSL